MTLLHRKSTAQEIAELIGIVLVIIFMFCLVVGFIGAIFAAPGYVVLLILGVPAGFWKSAAVGFGSLMLIGALFGGIKVVFVNKESKVE